MIRLGVALALLMVSALPADLFFLDATGQVWRFVADGSALVPVSPAGQVVLDFAVSPDGGAVAYRLAGGIVMRTVPEGDPVQIGAGAGPAGAEAKGRTIAWSPAGRPVAYVAGEEVRVYLSEEKTLEGEGGPFVHLSWSSGGHYLACERAGGGWMIFGIEPETLRVAGVLEGESDITWTPDGALVVASAAGGLRRVRLDGGAVHLLDATGRPASKPHLFDGAVYYFLHTLPGAPGVLHRLALTPEGSPAPEVVGGLAFDPGGALWVPGALELMAASENGLVLVNPVDGARAPVPNTAGASMWAWHVALPLTGTETAPPLPADLYFLAEDASGLAQVWRLRDEGGRPVPLTASEAGVGSFAVSRDGERLAYTSDGQLMVTVVGQPQAFPVAEGEAPAFDSQGKTLAYAAGGSIWAVPVEGSAAPRAMKDDRCCTRPRWSPDGTWLLVDVAADGGAAAPALLTVAGHGPLALDVPCGGVRWMPGNFLLCWGEKGLFKIMPGDPPGAEMLLGAMWPVMDAVYLSESGGVVFLQGSAELTAAQPLHLLPAGEVQPAGPGIFVKLPQLSPDGTMIAGLHRPEDGAGRILLVEVETGARTMLQTPARAWGLAWRDK